jgi:hypothetical protein
MPYILFDSYVYLMVYLYYWPMLAFDKQAKIQSSICKPQGVKNG